jgi:polar amino acid transport system substrate-binding protein
VATRTIRGASLAAAAGLALALTACGSSSSGSSTTPSSGPSSSSASASGGTSAGTIAVPDAIKSKGTLKIATDPSYAPNEFFDTDNKTIIGMDIDLANAIGQKLGLKVDVQQSSFDAIIPGLASGKYDMALSSFTDNKEREKTVDFVTYFTAGSSLMVKSGNPEKLSASDDSLCGKKVAVEKGTVQEDPDLPDRSKKCTDAGKAAITAQVFPDQNGANLALSSGRADAVLGDSPVIEYAAKQSNGQFEVSGESYDNAPYGIAIPKNNGLATPVLEAVKALIADGTYKKVLDKWGVADGAISDPKINGATS